MANLRADYSKAIAQNREKYFDASRKLKKNYEQDLKTIQDQNEKRVDKIQEINQEKIGDVYDQNEIKLKKMGNKLNEELDYQNKNYRNLLNDKTKDFNERRLKADSKYKRNIADISDAYEKSLRENKRINNNNIARIKNNFDHRLKELNNASDDRHYEMSEKSDASIKKLNHGYAEQKKDLLRENDDRVRNIIRTATDRENKLKDGFNQKYDEINRIHSEEQRRTDQKTAGIIAEARQRGNSDAEELIHNYRGMLRNQANKTHDLEKNLLHDKNITIAKNNKDHRDEMFDQKQKMNTLVNQGLQGQKKGLDALRRRQDDKMDITQRRNEVFYNDVNKKNDLMAQEYTDSIDELAKEKSTLLKEQDFKFQDRMKNYQGMAERRMDENSMAAEMRYTNLDKEKTDEIVGQEKSFKGMIDKQRRSFSSTIQHISEKNDKAYQELYDDFNREKDEIKKLAAQRLSDTTQENARAFNEKLSLTVQNFENKINYMEQKQQEQIVKLEEDLDKMDKEYQNKLKVLQDYELNVRKEERNNLMDTLNFQKKSLENENKNLRETFTKKIDQLEEDHEREVTNLKKEHADVVFRTNFENQKKMKALLAKTNKNYNDFVYESKLEKEQLIKVYEQKIADLKRYFETTISDVKDQSDKKSSSYLVVTD